MKQKFAGEIAAVLGISERQVFRRIADREEVALRALKVVLLLEGMGRLIDCAVRDWEKAMPDVARVDPAFKEVIDELIYRVKQWASDPLREEMLTLRDFSKPLDRDHFIYHRMPVEEWKETVREAEQDRLTQLAKVRKILTGSETPAPPEPDTPEEKP